MKSAFWMLLCFCLWTGCSFQIEPSQNSATSDRGTSPELRKAMDHAISQVYPALVRIYVVDVDHRDGREQKYESAGSGAIVTKEGHVVTNHHVAGKAKRIRCTLSTKEEIEAELIGTDALSDIAVIKLKTPLVQKLRSYPVARFGDSDRVKVGDHVLAMGSPVALSQSVTFGIVSNTEMVMPELFWGWYEFKLDGEDVGSIVRWIAHDADIYGGNSGGPLVSMTGEIIGINEIGLGLGGAIPGNVAKRVTEELIQKGRVDRSWIGTEVQPLLRSQREARGVLISSVVEGSPAQKAGLQPGDWITQFDGAPVSVRWVEELPAFNRMVLETPVGKLVKVNYVRQGTQRQVEIKTVDIQTHLRGKLRADTEEIRTWGMTAREITPHAARELKRPDVKGVLVTTVRPGGPCDEAKPAIRAWDIVTSVNNKPVQNLADLNKLTQVITEGQDVPVPTLVGFDRKTEQYLTVVKIGPTRESKIPLEARKAWFPAGTQVLTRELAEQLGLKDRKGVRITQIYHEIMGKEAPFRVGDVITGIDGEGIDATNPEDSDVFPTMIRMRKVNTVVEFAVIRDGKELKASYQLPLAPVPPSQMTKYRDDLFEFAVRDVADLDRVQEKLKPEFSGVLVTEVSPGGTTALGHLAVGDLILSVDGVYVSDVKQLKEIMVRIAAKKPSDVIMFVKRGIHTLYLEISPDWSKKH